jgi:4-hydroxy-tetrahydrodipicolinate synthase
VHGFSGVQAAAITPRGKDGEVDFGAAFELVDHLCRGGADGILLFGAPGEYPAFTITERARLVYLAAKRSRVPLLAGVGSATLDLSLELAREARDGGAAALVLPPPLFFRYDQDDLRAFYRQFAVEAGSDPPILIYRTEAMEPETALELWQCGRFAGVVDATGSIADYERLVCASVPVLSGDYAMPVRTVARGIVSAAACAVPELMAALHRALRAGVESEIHALDHSLQEFLRWVARFPEPAAVKLATSLRGLKTGPLIVPLSPEKQKDLDSFRDWFQRWLPAVRKLSANA